MAKSYVCEGSVTCGSGMKGVSSLAECRSRRAGRELHASAEEVQMRRQSVTLSRDTAEEVPFWPRADRIFAHWGRRSVPVLL